MSREPYMRVLLNFLDDCRSLAMAAVAYMAIVAVGVGIATAFLYAMAQ